jgi:D-aspartate ligase
LTFPVIAKPPLSFGGNEIRRCESPKELDAFLANRGRDKDWVVQEFIQGSDLCVNVLCQNGQIIAASVQHEIFPSSVPFAPAPAVELRCNASAMSVVERLMERLSWSGVAHVDMRLGAQDETPRVLEVNGRYWLSVLGSLQAGVNFPLLACEAVFGLAKSNRPAADDIASDRGKPI